MDLQRSDARSSSASRPTKVKSKPRNAVGSWEHARESGVWVATLFIPVFSMGVLIWILGMSVILKRPAPIPVAHGLLSSMFLQIGVCVGFLAILAQAFIACTIAQAPRLCRSSLSAFIPLISLVTFCASLALLWMSFSMRDELAGSLWAAILATTPALLLCVLAMALPIISNGKHGVELANSGAIWWFFTIVAIIALPFMPYWWIPVALAVPGTLATGRASGRLWERYEGSFVVAGEVDVGALARRLELERD